MSAVLENAGPLDIQKRKNWNARHNSLIRDIEFPDAWAEGILSDFPASIRDVLRERWMRVANKQSRYAPRARGELAPYAKANGELARFKNEIPAARAGLAVDDAEICEAAERFARMAQDHGAKAVTHHAEALGLELPKGRTITAEGIVARLCDPRWWRRKMRASIGQSLENAMRSRGLVRIGRAPYATDWAVRRRRSQKARMRDMLEAAAAVSSEGEQLSLLELAEHSISNPTIRRGEFMTRLRGFEELAQELGHTWTFATLTAPGAFHPQLAAGGDNPNYEGQGVRECQQWHTQRWARVRAQAARAHVQFYGFRICEPHHDGTPHWHLLLFCAPHELATLKKIMHDHWTADYAHELAHGRELCEVCKSRYCTPRVKFEDRNEAKAKNGAASACGYLAKYIAKNIDGFKVGEDFETGTDAAESCERVDAWASVHRIRQFQQVGGASVSLWRELRRLRAPVPPPEIEAARAAADRGNWRVFVQHVQRGRDAASQQHERDMGRSVVLELWKERTAAQNRYGEDRGPVTVGVKSLAHRIRTRLKEWVIKWHAAASAFSKLFSRAAGAFCSSLGPVSITVRLQKSAEDRADRIRELLRLGKYQPGALFGAPIQWQEVNGRWMRLN